MGILSEGEEKHSIDRIKAILSLNRALLRAVSPQLRAAAVSWNSREITIFMYYDGEISDEDLDSAQSVTTEVISDFPQYLLNEKIMRWDFPKEIPSEGELVYLRKE